MKTTVFFFNSYHLFKTTNNFKTQIRNDKYE